MNGKNVKPATPEPGAEQSESIQLTEVPLSIWSIASPRQAATVNLRVYGYSETREMVKSCIAEATSSGDEDHRAFWRETEAWLSKLSRQSGH